MPMMCCVAMTVSAVVLADDSELGLWALDAVWS